ncbi:tyrosine-type recombinase/integrase [Ectopseudomonas mendocina]
MVNFYKEIVNQGLITRNDLDNAPFNEITQRISTLDGKGFKRSITTYSHNLTIKGSKEAKDPEYLLDEGELKPLTPDDQIALLLELKASGNRAMQLIFYIALFTGARIQTCCTLKIKHLYEKLDSNQNMRLRIGVGTDVDNKNGKNMTLVIPGWLVNDLKIYVESPRAKALQQRSTKGESKENYVFLTNRGQPYYTSKSDAATYLHKVKSEATAQPDALKIYEGTTVRVFLSGLLKRITATNPEFHQYSFHDLRASFGMNLLERLLSDPKHTINSALTVLQQRMGHSDLETTMRYLNYRAHFNLYTETQDSYEQELLQYVEHQRPS